MTAPTCGSRSGAVNVPQIIRTHAHVAVADDQHFVRGFADKTGELGDFIVGRHAAGTHQGTDRAVWKVGFQLRNHRLNRRVVRIDAEDDLEFRIIEAAETGEVFVGARIESAKRFENAHRWQESRVGRGGRLTEIPPGTVDRNEVVDEWDRRDPRNIIVTMGSPGSGSMGGW